MYEIIDPLNPALEGTKSTARPGVTPARRSSRIDAFGFNAFEGLAILPNGVTYYGNELAAEHGAPGGAYYKFVPTTPWTPAARRSRALDQSPYASGSVYALRVGTSSNNGQGFQYGTGSWRPLAGQAAALLHPLEATAATPPATTGRRTSTSTRRPSRPATSASAATTPVATPPATSARRSASPTARSARSASGSTTPEVQLLVQGSQAINMPDNIAYQTSRANWIIHEDGSTDPVDRRRPQQRPLGLPRRRRRRSTPSPTAASGSGRSTTSTAEWTGGFFDADRQDTSTSASSTTQRLRNDPRRSPAGDPKDKATNASLTRNHTAQAHPDPGVGQPQIAPDASMFAGGCLLGRVV